MISVAMKRGNSAFFAVALIYLFLKQSEGFQWTDFQQHNRVISTKLGSDVTLPCQFLLTSDEKYAMQQFHLIFWTKESPAGSQSWQGIAAKSNLIGNSNPSIIHPRKSRYAMKNNYLTIYRVEHEDEGLYQCQVKSSFYTTPTVIKLKTISRQPYEKQTSSLSSGASAGISVGVILIVVAFIAVVAVLCLIKRKRERGPNEPTNLENITRDDAAEAHVGPGFPGNDTINEAVNNQYSEVNSKCTTVC